MTYLERDLEKEFCRRVAAMGGVALKMVHVEGRVRFPTRGTPDRLVILPGGLHVWVEWKRPGGKVSKHQEIWQDSLLSIGACHLIVDNVETAISVLESLP